MKPGPQGGKLMKKIISFVWADYCIDKEPASFLILELTRSLEDSLRLIFCITFFQPLPEIFVIGKVLFF